MQDCWFRAGTVSWWWLRDFGFCVARLKRCVRTIAESFPSSARRETSFKQQHDKSLGGWKPFPDTPGLRNIIWSRSARLDRNKINRFSYVKMARGVREENALGKMTRRISCYWRLENEKFNEKLKQGEGTWKKLADVFWMITVWQQFSSSFSWKSESATVGESACDQRWFSLLSNSISNEFPFPVIPHSIHVSLFWSLNKSLCQP